MFQEDRRPERRVLPQSKDGLQEQRLFPEYLSFDFTSFRSGQ